MADPLEALRGAQSLRDPYADPNLVKRGEMPLGPGFLGSVSEVAQPAISALRGILGRPGGAVETLGEHLPEFTPRGGEALFNAGRGAGSSGVETLATRGAGLTAEKHAPSAMAQFYQQNPMGDARTTYGGYNSLAKEVFPDGGLDSVMEGLKRMLGRP